MKSLYRKSGKKKLEKLKEKSKKKSKKNAPDFEDFKHLGLSREEFSIIKKLSTPIKIQNFLDTLPINWENDGDVNLSPRRVMREKQAHCFDGAMIAGLAIWIHGKFGAPLIIDLKTDGTDIGHLIALYQVNGYWGAISKTNHATLRFRDPVYKSIRELVMSYFHEYFSDISCKKVLRSYSGPFNIKKWGTKWITSEEDLYYIAEEIFDAKQHILFPKNNIAYLRKADKMEQKAGKLVEWKNEA